MQPLAICAVVIGAAMVTGVAVTLVRSGRAPRPRHSLLNRWQLHGSIPLAGAGLALGVMSRSSGQSPATYDIIFAEATALLVAALLCSLVGAAAASRGSTAAAGR